MEQAIDIFHLCGMKFPIHILVPTFSTVSLEIESGIQNFSCLLLTLFVLKEKRGIMRAFNILFIQCLTVLFQMQPCKARLNLS